MSEPNLDIRCIQVGELDEYARKTLDTLHPSDVVPISRSRAHAYSTNPRAERDDVSLIVAYQDDRCVGYLGMIPGLLTVDGKWEKLYWLSSWYVAPAARPTGVGAMLMMRALSLRRPILVTGFSEEAARVYEGLRFQPLGPLRYLQVDFKPVNVLGMPLRLWRKVLYQRGREHTPHLDQWIRAIDGIGVKPFYLPLRTMIRQLDQALTLKRVQVVADETVETAPDDARPVRFFRGVNEINWMLRDRWVVKGPEAATEGYYFRDFDPFFAYHVYELYGKPDEQYKGFVVMRADGKRSRRNLTVLDYHFLDAADQRYLVPLAFKQAREDRADVISLPSCARAACNHSWMLRRLVRDVERTYYCHPSRNHRLMAMLKDRLVLHLADGDQGFA